jgi:dCTP deaminase
VILPGQEIQRRKLIDPCVEKYKFTIPTFPLNSLKTSGGLSNASYDVALDQEIILGPAGWRGLLGKIGSWFRLCEYHSSFSLASTVEKFTMPLDVAGIVCDKSTFARLGVAVQNTFIDPGWKGWLTLEISNNGEQTIVIPKGCPIAQIVFHLLFKPALVAYEGKYQNQERGPQEAR